MNIRLLILVLITISIPSCSEKPKKSKVNYTENPIVQESLENYVLPIIESFDLEYLRGLGYSSSYNSDTKTFDEKIQVEVQGHSKQSKVQKDLGYMFGIVILQGSSNQRLDFWFMDWIFLTFTKISHDEPWRLITHNGYTDGSFKDNNESEETLPPEFHTYIKSKFNTIKRKDWILSDSMKKILDTNKKKNKR
jgi:hypothetical protein